MNDLTKDSTRLERWANSYESHPLMPFMVWGLNTFGLGAVDRLISKRATDFYSKRVEMLMRELEKRIDSTLPGPKSEHFIPAMNKVMADIFQSQGEEKLRVFARILSDAWNNEGSSWDDLSQSLKIISSLEDLHILILKESIKLNPRKAVAPVTFSIGDAGYSTSQDLGGIFPRVGSMLLLSCMSDLVALGLMNDTFETVSFAGDDRGNIPHQPPAAYSISELGRWLISRINSNV